MNEFIYLNRFNIVSSYLAYQGIIFVISKNLSNSILDCILLRLDKSIWIAQKDSKWLKKVSQLVLNLLTLFLAILQVIYKRKFIKDYQHGEKITRIKFTMSK